MKSCFWKLLIVVFLPAVVELNAANPNTAPPAQLNISCHICSSGADVNYSGTGFKHGTTVILDVQGPVAYTIICQIDKQGNLSAYNQALLAYAPGYYSVTASEVSGKRLIPVAQDGFEVQ